MARHPRRWPWPAAGIAEQVHRLLPAQFLPVTKKRLLPVLALLVPPFVYKLLVLAVRDLESIDIEGGKIVWSKVSERPDHVEELLCRHGGHSFRGSRGSIQREVEFTNESVNAVGNRSADVLSRTGFRNSPAQIAVRNFDMVERSRAQRKPWVAWRQVVFDFYGGSRGC